MNDFNATMIAEGCFELAGVDPDALDEVEVEELQRSAWQHLIDTGLAWQLQGSFGRMAAHLIEQGICSPAEARA